MANASDDFVAQRFNKMISVGASGIVEIGGEFFLIVLIEIEAKGVDIERVVVFRLTPGEAAELIEAGIGLCEIADAAPQACTGVDSTFQCVLVIDDQAFLVFVVRKNNTVILLLVSVDLCPIID